MDPRPGRWARTLGSLIGIAVLLGVPVLAAAESVTLAWDRNPEEDLAGYKVYVGTRPGTYTQTIDVGHVTTFGVSGLLPGETYYIALTAYDIFANESGHSAELRASIPKAPVPTPEPEPALEPPPGPEVSPEPAAPTPPPATQADAGSAESVGGGGGGTDGAADGGESSSPGVLASLLDSVRNVFSGSTSSTALVPPSESSSSPVPASVSAGIPASQTNPINPTNQTGTGGTAGTGDRLRGAREREIEAERFHQEGRDLYTQGRVGEAIAQLRQAERIWDALPLSEEAGFVAHDLGVAYYAADRHGEAIQAYMKALAIYQQLEKQDLQARVLDNIGSAYEGLGDYASADEQYRASLEIWEAIGKRDEVAAVLDRLGGTQAAAGQYEAALATYERSLDLFRELGNVEKLEELKDAIAQVEHLAKLSAVGTVGK